MRVPPHIDELRKLKARELAAECLRWHDPDTLQIFWQLSGMVAARLDIDGSPLLATAIMDLGRSDSTEAELALIDLLQRIERGEIVNEPSP